MPSLQASCVKPVSGEAERSFEAEIASSGGVFDVNGNLNPIQMIKHIVMWKVRGETREERREVSERIKHAFDSLVGKIPGMTSLEVGIELSETDYACDVVLCTEFESQESLDAYATHPAHLGVRDELGDCRIARYQVDYVPRAH